MKYQITIQTRQGEVRFYAWNIISASEFIAKAHTDYRNYGMTVGTDYNITLMSDYGQEENFDNNEVERYETSPIRVGIIA